MPQGRGVGGPQAAELGAEGEQFADKLAQGPVLGFASASARSKRSLLRHYIGWYRRRPAGHELPHMTVHERAALGNRLLMSDHSEMRLEY